jgi:hypothetical protein
MSCAYGHLDFLESDATCEEILRNSQAYFSHREQLKRSRESTITFAR